MRRCARNMIPWATRWMQVLAVLAAPLSAAGDATDLQEAMARVQHDIREASAELAEATDTIAAQRDELVNGLHALRHAVHELRDARQTADDRHTALREAVDDATEELRLLRNNLTIIHTTVREHRQAFETRTDIAGALKAGPRLHSVDEALHDAVLQPAAAVESISTISLDFLSGQLGGDLFTARVATPDGLRVTGSVSAFGPIVFFAGADGIPPGPVAQRRGSLTPTVLNAFSPRQQQSIERLHSGDLSDVPIDVSLGLAYRLIETRDNIWDHLRKGRAVMVPLLALGATCAILALYKLGVLTMLVSGKAHAKIAEILDALSNGDSQRALALAGTLRKPLAAVMIEGIRHHEAPKEHLEEIMYERLISQTPQLERFLSPLAVCASAAPLLGLLGTVTGMIHTFRLITVFGTGDPAVLSAGISEALVTTEVGLIVAVPALLIHAFLSRRVRRAVALTQQAALTFVNRLKLRNPDAVDGKQNATAPGPEAGAGQ